MPCRIPRTRVLWGTRPSTTSHTIPSLRIHIANSAPPITPAHHHHRRRCYVTENTTSRAREPLRILFCGSDIFSCASLFALHELRKADPRLVDSIDVLVRPGKPSGRGHRRVAVGPVFHLAEALGLPIHQRDTFNGWDLPLPGHVAHPKTGDVAVIPQLSDLPLPGYVFARPETGDVATVPHHLSGPQEQQQQERPRHPFNLIIAVSFGLFVPNRILSKLAYGGINVHPSLLPDLHGPAPLQWTILTRRFYTGVTVQTMHPRAFDRGEVLAQTPAPGVPVPYGCTTDDLVALLAPHGARLLVDALQRGLYLGPPYAPVPDRVPVDADRARHAPKIDKSELTVDWGRCVWAPKHPDLYPEDGGAWTASDLERRFRALAAPRPGPLGTLKPGPGLWTNAITVKNPCEMRVIFSDVEAIICPLALIEVVTAIVQAKQTPPASSETAPPETIPIPPHVVNVVWAGQALNAKDENKSTEYRLPLMIEDDGSVIIPVRLPYIIQGGEVMAVLQKEPGEIAILRDAVRIKMAKVEGETEKPAAQALGRFMEKNIVPRDFSFLDYAMDVMVKRVEE